MLDAALMRPSLSSQRVTHRSRGNASIAALEPWMLSTKIVSVRSPPALPVLSSLRCSSDSRSRLSDPVTRTW
jgi:hypothetical protein